MLCCRLDAADDDMLVSCVENDAIRTKYTDRGPAQERNEIAAREHIRAIDTLQTQDSVMFQPTLQLQQLRHPG